MGYLDDSGLSYFFSKVKGLLSKKADAFTVGDGLDKQEDVLNVKTPVKALTKAEYDALTTDQKKNGSLYVIKDVTPQITATGSSAYSTEEMIVGTWTDGRPLYRKVIEGVFSASKDCLVDSSMSGIENMDLLITAMGYIERDTVGQDFVPNMFFYIANMGDSTILLQSASTYYYNKPFSIIVEYTKTTDVAPVSMDISLEKNEVVLSPTIEIPKTLETASGEKLTVTYPFAGVGSMATSGSDLFAGVGSTVASASSVYPFTGVASTAASSSDLFAGVGSIATSGDHLFDGVGSTAASAVYPVTASASEFGLGGGSE